MKLVSLVKTFITLFLFCHRYLSIKSGIMKIEDLLSKSNDNSIGLDGELFKLISRSTDDEKTTNEIKGNVSLVSGEDIPTVNLDVSNTSPNLSSETKKVEDEESSDVDIPEVTVFPEINFLETSTSVTYEEEIPVNTEFSEINMPPLTIKEESNRSFLRESDESVRMKKEYDRGNQAKTKNADLSVLNTLGDDNILSKISKNLLNTKQDDDADNNVGNEIEKVIRKHKNCKKRNKLLQQKNHTFLNNSNEEFDLMSKRLMPKLILGGKNYLNSLRSNKVDFSDFDSSYSRLFKQKPLNRLLSKSKKNNTPGVPKFALTSSSKSHNPNTLVESFKKARFTEKDRFI